MKQFVTSTLLLLGAASMASAQCNVYADNFDAYPGGTPLQAITGWGVIGSSATINPSSINGNGAITLSPVTGQGPSFAYRQFASGTIPSLANFKFVAMTDATTNLLVRLECPSPPPGSPIAPLILSFDPAAATVSLILGTSVLGSTAYTANSPVPVHCSVDQATNFAVTVGGTSLFVGPWNAPGFPTCSDIRTMVLIASNGSGASAGAAWVDDICIGDEVGSRYCPTVPNTTGQSGSITVTGADHVALNTLTLTATSLPPNQFGMFYCSQTPRELSPVNWPSNGYLCVGGTVGRFNDPSQILNTGAQGTMSLQVDLTQVPEGNNLVTVTAGQTWNFQGWYRDIVGDGNNTTDAVAVLFH